MAPDSAEQDYAQAVIETVRDLTAKVEAHTRTGEEARRELLASVEARILDMAHAVEASVASMRTDVHKAILSLQLNQADHNSSHEADRIERVGRQQQVDTQLMNRQQQIDLQFVEVRKWLIVALIGIALLFAVIFFLIGWLVF